MPLTFPTDFDFVAVTTAPRSQFELEKITRHYKAAGATEEEVLAATGLPDIADAHPLFPFMFVTGLKTAETGDKACALDVEYTGATRDDGAGHPILPKQRHKYGNPVQTASSTILVAVSHFYYASAEPVATTLEFYAQTSELVFFSYLTPGALGTALDPVNDPIPIDLTIGSASISVTSLAQAANFFGIRQTDIIDPVEVVAGKYWQNTERKTLYFCAPFLSIATFGGPPPTKVVACLAPGRGYGVGNSLTISGGGGSASITVTAIGVRGEITGISLSADTIDAGTQVLILPASGGAGTGAKFVAFNLA